MLSGHSLVCMVLIEGIIKLKFAILRSGATINDRDKSERSNGTKDSWTSTKTLETLDKPWTVILALIVYS